MRKNLASAIILGATMALSVSLVSPTFAAYPPKNGGVDNSTVSVGVSTEKADPHKASASTANTFISQKENKPADVTVQGLPPKTVVPSTLKDPNGKVVKLPTLVVDSKGNLNLKNITFKTPGTYLITYSLPGGKKKTVTITVKK